MIERYEERRAALMEEREGPCMVMVFSGKAPMRSADEAYDFSVDRSFYYLTGLDRENMVLVMTKGLGDDVTETLYLEPYDEFLAKWVGGRMRPEEAANCSGVENVEELSAFPDDVHRFLDTWRGLGTTEVWLDLWRNDARQADTQAHQAAAWLQKRYPAAAIRELYGDLAALRAIKDEDELKLMCRAQAVTKNAIEAMLRYARPGMNETEIEGAFDFALMQQGCREHAFPTITAGGPRATTLHYGENNCVVEDGQLVLVDLGSAEGHYCADISRTFPVNGKFTPRQKELYNTVLEAQRLVIKAARPGLSMGDLTGLTEQFYDSRLDALGLRKNGKTVEDYFYHSVTHSLGLDTHDICTPRELILQPGMVITAEPGLYVEDEGIGIRIEDDILITEEGAIDLSAAIPKTVEEIEAIMRK